MQTMYRLIGILIIIFPLLGAKYVKENKTYIGVHGASTNELGIRSPDSSSDTDTPTLKWSTDREAFCMKNSSSADCAPLQLETEDVSQTNFLTNGGFEKGEVDWTESSMTLDIGSNTAYNKESFGNKYGQLDSGGAGSLSSAGTIYVPAPLRGAACRLKWSHAWAAKNGAEDVTIVVQKNGTDNLHTPVSLTVTGSATDWVSRSIGFTCPPLATDTINIKIETDLNMSQIDIDGIHVGNDFDVGQVNDTAELYGVVDIVGDDSPICDWQGIGGGVPSTNNLPYTADSDCTETRAAFGSGAPSYIDKPGMTFDGLPVGRYSIKANTYFVVGLAEGTCSWRLKVSGGTIADQNLGQYNLAARAVAGDQSRPGSITGTFELTEAVTGTIEFEVEAKKQSGNTSMECDISMNNTNRAFTMEVYRYPTQSPRDVLTLDTQGQVWEASLYDTGANFTMVNDVAYQGIPTAAGNLEAAAHSRPIGIACSGTNEGTVPSTTCAGGSEQVGVVFDVLTSGLHEACVQFTLRYNSASTGQAGAFNIVQTPNNAQTITVASKAHIQFRTAVNSATYRSHNFNICGIFDLTAGKNTLRLFQENEIASIGNLIIESGRIADQGDADITWKIYPITQNFPQAVALTDLTVNEDETGDCTSPGPATNICSGTWTASGTGGTCTSESYPTGFYTRVGHVVSGSLSITAACGPGQSVIFSPPILPSGNFTGVNTQAMGSCILDNASIQDPTSLGPIQPNTSSTNLLFYNRGASTGTTRTFRCQFSYQLF